MYACNVYDVTDAFAENCRQETYDNVRRLRHHASLGLWCGNNEIESAWDHWGDFQKETPYLRADYIRLFEEVLPKAVQEADGETFYWHSSPSSGGCFDNPDDANRGDTHYWDVWHGQKPFTDYRKYFSVSAPNSVFSLSHVQRPSTVLLWKMTAIFSPVSWKAIRKMMRQTVRCSTICPKIFAIQKI